MAIDPSLLSLMHSITSLPTSKRLAESQPALVSPVAPGVIDAELRDDLSCSSLSSAPPPLNANYHVAVDDGAESLIDAASCSSLESAPPCLGAEGVDESGATKNPGPDRNDPVDGRGSQKPICTAEKVLADLQAEKVEESADTNGTPQANHRSETQAHLDLSKFPGDDTKKSKKHTPWKPTLWAKEVTSDQGYADMEVDSISSLLGFKAKFEAGTRRASEDEKKLKVHSISKVTVT
jgi:hypothetical protein